MTTVAIVTMIASIIGFAVTMMLNAFVLDDYDAYGEVPIPGSSSLRLPAGDVTVTFHTVLIGGGGSGLPVPALQLSINAPEGIAKPQLTDDYGTTTTVNNDAHVRIGYLHVPREGTYDISVDGNVSAYLNPTLAFGHNSDYGSLPLVFAGLFGVAVVGLVIARVWTARTRRSPTPSFGSTFPPPPTASFGSSFPPPPMPAQPAESFTPADEGIRVQSLNTLARLRDSGALTQQEYEAEKKRVLEGP
jgi:hypothetical protein